jgi:hypothetical protein
VAWLGPAPEFVVLHRGLDLHLIPPRYRLRVLRDRRAFALLTVVSALALSACGSDHALTAGTPVAGNTSSQPAATPGTVASEPAPSTTPTPARKKRPGPSAKVRRVTLVAGNRGGGAAVPAAGRAAGVSHPDHVIGRGSPAGCTSSAVVAAVAAGGTITFDCGPAPLTITLNRTAKLRNAHPDVVLDGGGLVTLSGAGRRRILYLNTCDQAQGWTTSHCNDQDHPRLTVQNLTLRSGNATGQTTDGGGGGAIFARGGRLKVVHSRFVGNTCDRTGPDLGGAAIRVLDQAGKRPVYVTDSTFERGTCSNGGALSSIGVSWIVLNSRFSHNSAVGRGANPARAGQPGGGSGGAIYTDGNTYTVTLRGTRMENNHANEGGGAVFFVSNDHTGSLTIADSTLRANPNDGFQTAGCPGIFYLGTGSRPSLRHSTLEP